MPKELLMKLVKKFSKQVPWKVPQTILMNLPEEFPKRINEKIDSKLLIGFTEVIHSIIAEKNDKKLFTEIAKFLQRIKFRRYLVEITRRIAEVFKEIVIAEGIPKGLIKKISKKKCDKNSSIIADNQRL